MSKSKRARPWYEKYLRSKINEIWGWSPARKAAKKRAQTGKNPDSYKCARCPKDKLFKGDFEVDHIVPAESITEWDGWSSYIERKLAVTVDGLQILCHECHDDKNAVENKSRRDFENDKTRS